MRRFQKYFMEYTKKCEFTANLHNYICLKNRKFNKICIAF